MTFPSPWHLTQALRGEETQRDAARACLVGLFSEAAQRFIRNCTEGRASEREIHAWTRRALCWQEMRLRSAPPGPHEGWRDFRIKEISALAMLVTDVFQPGDSRPRLPRSRPPAPDPGPTPLTIQAHFQPCGAVGGDWYVTEGGEDGSLWVLVIDVAGKGEAAHLIAEGLPWLWRSRRVAQARAEGARPRQLLQLLAADLEEVLPAGLFVEATLGQFTPERVLVAAAGSCPVARRQRGEPRLALVTLGGPFLGIFLDEGFGEQSWPFEPGEEWALASDGLFDQPGDDRERLKTHLARLELPAGRSLHHLLVSLVQEAAARHGQHDDVTVVTVGRPLGGEEDRE